jgi:transcription elongation factor GreA
MRVPIRKGGKYTGEKLDPHMTKSKHDALASELERLKKKTQPRVIAEMQRMAELGDFSENAGYQIAKGQLRAINQRMDEIKDHVARAVLIPEGSAQGIVKIGSRVTIEVNTRRITYTILGPTETDPAHNVISYLSPLGASLLGKRVDDSIMVRIAGKEHAGIIHKIA